METGTRGLRNEMLVGFRFPLFKFKERNYIIHWIFNN